MHRFIIPNNEPPVMLSNNPKFPPKFAILSIKEYLGVIASGTPIHGKRLQSSGINQGIESLLFTSEWELILSRYI